MDEVGDMVRWVGMVFLGVLIWGVFLSGAGVAITDAVSRYGTPTVAAPSITVADECVDDSRGGEAMRFDECADLDTSTIDDLRPDRGQPRITDDGTLGRMAL